MSIKNKLKKKNCCVTPIPVRQSQPLIGFNSRLESERSY